jgi:S-adenosylmethionine:tRNA ribosyltransferase-isomerase
MKTSEFDYELPAELIAQRPLPDRAASRMMVVERASGEICHEQFRHLGAYLRAGDLLVLNDTKVIPARIWSREPVAELLLVEKLADNLWSALVKPAKKARRGAVLEFAGAVSNPARTSGAEVPAASRMKSAPTGGLLTAVVEGTTDFGGRVLRFSGDVEAYLEKHGAAPLPPYIHRDAPEPYDLERYQTVFAKRPGAVAAPTAGLHFTAEMLEQLRNAGIGHTFITLHVGIGTFRPVKTETIEEHKMHAEMFSVSAEAAAAMRAVWSCGRGISFDGLRTGSAPIRLRQGFGGQAGRDKNVAPTEPKSRIIAVGTTVVRTLETLGEPRIGEGSTDIFIRPPFQFRVVDALLTNFHLPRSTLLMLVCALASRELILRAYAEAVRERYRFFSYGDCMLII